MNKEQIAVFASEGAKAGAGFKAFSTAFIEAANGVHGAAVVEAAAHAFQAYYQSIVDLAFDKYGIPREEADGTGQCSACWCNDCAKIDICTAYPKTDGLTPPPCAACADSAEPLQPKDDQPDCGEYHPDRLEREEDPDE